MVDVPTDGEWRDDERPRWRRGNQPRDELLEGGKVAELPQNRGAGKAEDAETAGDSGLKDRALREVQPDGLGADARQGLAIFRPAPVICQQAAQPARYLIEPRREGGVYRDHTHRATLRRLPGYQPSDRDDRVVEVRREHDEWPGPRDTERSCWRRTCRSSIQLFDPRVSVSVVSAWVENGRRAGRPKGARPALTASVLDGEGRDAGEEGQSYILGAEPTANWPL